MVESLVLAICRNDMRKKVAYSMWDLVKEIGEKESGIRNAKILNKLKYSFSLHWRCLISLRPFNVCRMQTLITSQLKRFFAAGL
ncbi:hypothetical protein Fmac_006556 [Flemingia macrophylla]|uniref:Uncharacterized protein n=1 Tax=Flemingia macrophylla TaxID=520843 RepID=A0ABD1NBH2_9FABA